MKSSISLLSECIGGWFQSNPYLIAGYEIRRANQERFDILDRKTQTVGMHIEIRDNIMRFWWLEYSSGNESGRWINSTIVATSYVSSNCVSFETIDGDMYNHGLIYEMDAADPQFFNWLRDWVRLTIYTYLNKTYGLDSLR